MSTLEFTPTLRRSLPRGGPDFEKLDAAMEAAEAGRHLESVQLTIGHFSPAAEVHLEAAPFVFVQGSSKVVVALDGDDLVVSTSLVRLPAGGRAIAAMRFLLERLSGVGQLYEPRLSGDRVRLEFRDALVRFHPYKLVEVLRRMPGAADRTDDWLIEEFAAVADDRAEISPATEDEAAQAHRFWVQHWDTCAAILEEVQRKRSMWFLNEATAYAINAPVYVLPLAGALGARLGEMAGEFDNPDVDPGQREVALARCIERMRAVSADELKAQLGHATYAIDPRGRGTARMLDDTLGQNGFMDTVARLREGGQVMEAGLGLFSAFTYLLARFSWPEEVSESLAAALRGASGKPWRDLAKSAFDDARRIAATFGGEPEESDDETSEGEEA